jgi:hypothetical protein
MGAILALILPLLSQLPGKVGDYFKGQQEIEQLKQEAVKELQLANIKLAGELAKAELERQKEVLKATGAYFKYFTFGMWFGPYCAQVICPPLGKQIFENMLGMPEWYAQSCVAIMFTIWGISVSAPVIEKIFNGLGQFFKQRQIIKVATSANADNTTLFEVIRAIAPGKQLSQAQVDKINAALGKDK